MQNWVNSNISISDVNNLPTVFDEIKNQIAFSLRGISVEVWNSYSNIDVSIDLITKANNITGLKTETRENLTEARYQLLELKRKIDLTNSTRQRTVPVSSKTVIQTSKTSDNNTGCLWIIGIIVVIGIFYAISNSNKRSSYSYTAPSSYTTPSTNSYQSPSTSDYSSNSTSNNSPVNTPSTDYSPSVESNTKAIN